MTTAAVLRSPPPALFGGSPPGGVSSGGFRGVRISKFRHVYGQTTRREQCYEGLRITTSAHDSQFCAVNPKFIAVAIDVAGGGAFQVLPLKWVGKVDYHFGRVSAHGGPITDLEWNPFNDNIIATASDDSTIKLWHIPDEGLRSFVNKWLIELAGHTRRVAYINWHPTAENILASVGFDHKVLVWNVSTGECLLSAENHPDTIYSLSFNRVGDRIATTCKDKLLRVLDARTGHIVSVLVWNVSTGECLLSAENHPDTIYSLSFNRVGDRIATTCKDKLLRVLDARTGHVVSETVCHEGTKTAKVIFLGGTGKLLTAGFNKSNRRQISLWKETDMKIPLVTIEIDASSGVLFPFFDPDLGVLYLAGKGDGNIRYYELTDTAPYLHYLSEFQSRFPQRGFGVMPKRGLHVGQCEIFRLYKVHSTQPLVEPLSFVVPRKSETFQSDLFPPTASPTPSCSADEWLCGLDREPVRVSLRGVAAVTSKPVTVVKHRSAAGGLDDVNVLITADQNNERKFRFLSEVTKPDYRDVQEREDYEVIKNERQVREKMSERLVARQSSAEGVDTISSEAANDATSLGVCSLPPLSPPTVGRQHRSAASHASAAALHSPNKIRKVHDYQKPSLVAYRGCASMDEPLRPVSLTDEINRVLGKPSAVVSDDTSNGGGAHRAGCSTAVYHSDTEDVVAKRSVGAVRPPPPPTTTTSGTSSAAATPHMQRVASSTEILDQPQRNRTRPGNIGPGPVVRNETSTAHVKPFRVTPAVTKTKTNPVVGPAAPLATAEYADASYSGANTTQTPMDVELVTADGTETELHRMYTAQCRRVRELLTETERQSERGQRLDSELTRVTRAHDRLLADGATQREDIKSLRYEIRWKDERIAFLENELSKMQSSSSTQRSTVMDTHATLTSQCTDVDSSGTPERELDAD